jgi:hypothetical protein
MKGKAKGGRKDGGETTSPEELAFVDLLRTSDLLTRGIVQALKPADLSPTQYNVLRILRGSREGLSCGEIAKRMITRPPGEAWFDLAPQGTQGPENGAHPDHARGTPTAGPAG